MSGNMWLNTNNNNLRDSWESYGFKEIMSTDGVNENKPIGKQQLIHGVPFYPILYSFCP